MLVFSLRFLHKVPVFPHLVRGSKVRESLVRWSKVRGWCIDSRYLAFKKIILVNSNYTISNLINYKQQCQDPCWGSNLLGSEVLRLVGFSPRDDLLPASVSAPKQDFETIYSKRSMLIHILFDSILWSTLCIQSTRWLKLPWCRSGLHHGSFSVSTVESLHPREERFSSPPPLLTIESASHGSWSGALHGRGTSVLKPKATHIRLSAYPVKTRHPPPLHPSPPLVHPPLGGGGGGWGWWLGEGLSTRLKS